jgi:hypothetical protein
MRTNRKTRKNNHPRDYVGLRGGIEVCLKNALTGEELMRQSGENTVLYIGRNMLMTRAFTSASQTNIIVPCIVIGSGNAAANATNTTPGSYFTFKTGGIAQTTQSGGTGQPLFSFTASWESTELNAAGFNSVQEFLLGFQTVSNQSAMTPFLCRYVSGSAINATTSNQLLVTYTVSF